MRPDTAGTVEALLAELAALAPREVTQETVQRLLQASVRLYFAKRSAGEDFGPFLDNEAVAASEVMVAAANMLRAADLEVFELGMWTAFGG